MVTHRRKALLSPSHDASESFTDSADESLDNLLSQLEPLLPQNNGTWSVYVCNLMKNTEGTIDDQQMQAASLIKLFIMGAVYENFDSLCDTYGADSAKQLSESNDYCK